MNPVTSYPQAHNRIAPDRVNNYIRRQRLLEHGRSALLRRVTTVVAPAGYGKSAWVASLLDETDWPCTAWLNLDSRDLEPSLLLYHLIEAMQAVLPDFGEESLRIMKSLDDAGRDCLIAVSALIEELPREQEIVLVIDDYHLVDCSEAARGLVEYFIHWMPYNIHLVLIGRTGTALNLYREQCRGELLEIHQSDLLFSASETGELLSLLGLGLDEDDVVVIQALTEGWAILVGLLGIQLQQHGGDWKSFMPVNNKEDPDFFRHLSHIILDSLRPDLHEFLQDASLLPYLDASLCDAALGRRDSDTMLRDLYPCGMLSEVEQETGAWRLHHLMGACLKQRMPYVRAPEQITAIRRRAAAYLEQRGDIDRALEQVVACNDWPQAIGLISKYGDRYFLQYGRLDALHSWIARAPGELVAANQWILYFQGMGLLHANPDNALATLSSAVDLAGKRGDIRCQLRSLLLMMCAYAFSNNAKKLWETADRIPVAASLLKDGWSRGVVLVAGLAHATWSDNLRKGFWLSWLADKSTLDSESRMTRSMCSSIIQYRLGNLATARQTIEELLADPYIRENERWTGTAYTIYAAVCMLSGDHPKMLDICEELLRLGQKHHVPHQLGIAHRCKARLLQREGDLIRARSEYELSRGLFLKANNIFLARQTDLDLLSLRMAAGENPSEMLAEAEDILSKLRAMPAGRGLDDYALSAAGFIAMEAGDLKLARQLFEELSRNCSEKGARQMMAGTHLLLGYLHLTLGDESASDVYLHKALGAAEAAKWENFWDWRPEIVYAMCCRALIRGIHPDWAARLLRRWFPQRIYKDAGHLLASANDDVRAVAAGMLKDIAREAGRVVVHANCLDGFRLFVNGVEVPKVAWKTQKAEKLCKLLLMSGDRLPKEKVIDKLWPESTPQAGDGSLRTALSHIRKALCFDRYGIEGVAQRREMVYISPEVEIHTDYQVFATLARDGMQLADNGDPRSVTLLKQAAELYKGVFLPDDLYEDWPGNTRIWLQNLYLQVLSRLIDCCLRQDKTVAALEACRRYLVLEPADEQIIRTAMELCWRNGQRQKAIDLFQRLAVLLADDYGVKPSPETVKLYERLRQ
jgi:ATP/maltotriose-dependent transcriptional regulator MalT